MSFKKKRKRRVYNSEEGYNIYASDYDASLQYLNSFEKDSVFKLLGDLRGKKVLDIGCGTGRIIEELKQRGAEVVGLDVSEKILEIAKKKFCDVEFVLGNVNDLPFEDESFDLVLGLFLIVHLKNLEKPFEEIYRVLRPGGRFILSNINQKKAPKLKLKNRDEIVIKSHYHIPKHVVKALEQLLFVIKRDEFVYEGNAWINQIIKAVK